MKKFITSFLFVFLLLIATVSKGQTVRDTTRITVGDSTVVTVKTTTTSIATASTTYTYPVVSVSISQYKVANTSSTPNLPPLVNAGNNQSIFLPVSSVTLSGSATDPDGSVVSSIWTKVSGTGGTISNPTALTTTVTGLTAGSYVFRLSATDNQNATSSANTSVTVTDTTTLPQPNGKLLIDNNFEGATPFITNGGNWLADKQFCCAYSVTQNTTIAHEGKASYEATVKVNDASSSNGLRAEIQPKKCLDGSDYADNGDMWYGWSNYFLVPVSGLYWTGGYGGHFIQWHPNNTSGSAELALYGSDGVWDVTVNASGGAGGTHQSKTASGGPLLKITGNVWHNCVTHVNWTTGLVEFYLDGTLYFTQSGLKWLANPYLKFGMNRWSITNTWDILYDNLRIGRNTPTNPIGYADVVPKQ